MAGFTAMEGGAFFRWYFLVKRHSDFFVQADAGIYLFLEDEKISPLFDGGLRLGFRIPAGERYYMETYARGGYPFVFGAQFHLSPYFSLTLNTNTSTLNINTSAFMRKVQRPCG